MTTTWLWFVLAGFLLGFTTSTLWEWFHFRKVRVEARDQRVRDLEAKLHALEEMTATPAAQTSAAQDEQPISAPRYRSPGVFLESEETVDALPSTTQTAAPEPAPVSSETVPPETVPNETIIVTPTQRRMAGQTVHAPENPPSRAEPLSVRRHHEMRALAARREALRRGPRAQTNVPSAEPPEPPAPRPSWRDNPELTRRTADYPDNLSKIKGVGDVYRQRLYGAGIYTWRQVAATEVSRLRQATHAYPGANVEEWPSQARQLAEQHGRADAVYSGPPPDELTRIVGIGPVGAQTLYRAGICTYEQLAVTPVEDLAAIFPIAVAGDQPDFAHWIAQAALLADAKHRD